MSTVLVEYRHDPPLDDAELAAFTARLQRCLDVRFVTVVRGYLSLDRKTQIVIYDGADAHTVQMVLGMQKVTPVRVVAVTDLT